MRKGTRKMQRRRPENQQRGEKRKRKRGEAMAGVLGLLFSVSQWVAEKVPRASSAARRQ